jgi:hypothetical protein
MCLTKRSLPILLLITTTALLSITLNVGCPVPQVPDPPSENSNSSQDPISVPPPDNSRPPTPPTPANSSTQDADSGYDPNGGGSTGNAYVGFTQPFYPVAVLPGATVEVRFTVTLDRDTAIAEVDLLVARDDNEDRSPDGDPVYEQVITDAVVPGSNGFLFLTEVLEQLDLLNNGFGRFLVGVCVCTTAGKTTTAYAPGTITVDSTRPTMAGFRAGPDVQHTDQEDHLIAKTTPQWVIVMETADNSPHKVRILLDLDEIPLNGNEIEIVNEEVSPGPQQFVITPAGITSGNYFYYYSISDDVGQPLAGYAINDITCVHFRLGLTNRMIGDFNFNWLDPDLPSYYKNGTGPSMGAILQGFNFNDLAGSSMCTVPDVNGDQLPELLVAARFGKPYLQSARGVGFGEAYLFYGQANRLRDKLQLNAAGLQSSTYPTLVFPGIRAPKDETWTYGLAGIAAIPDMDGDTYPELVFSFPRVESVPLILGKTAEEMKIQSVPPDGVVGDASLEYNAYRFDEDAGKYRWYANEAQFTRGGVVIVSSQSYLLRQPDRLNRRGDRVLDLAEVGQIFDQQGAPSYVPFIWNAVDNPGTAQCGTPPVATPYDDWTVYWDIVLFNQGPGGFDNAFTSAAFAREKAPPAFGFEPDPFQPPLANPRSLLRLGVLNGIVPPVDDKCGTHCVVNNAWRVFGDCSLPTGGGFPGTWDAVCQTKSWHASFEQAESGQAIWSGFYGPNDPGVTPNGDAVGARILGQRREDRFGTGIAADGTYLYITSPECEASDRATAGAVYQMRTFAKPGGSATTQTQLWIEPRDLAGTVTPRWPFVDVHDPARRDWTMPVPHQYIIRSGGSLRGEDVYVDETGSWPPPFGQPTGGSNRLVTYTFQGAGCLQQASRTVTGGMAADIVLPYPEGSPLWPAWGDGTAAYYVETARQFVGPHVGAKLTEVRIVGDLNRDGTPDFGVGSPDVMTTFSDPEHPSGCVAGAVFIVLERPTGVGGEIDLGRIALRPDHPRRLAGVMIRGVCNGEEFGRVFDAAGDFNGDGFDDVLIGSEGYDQGRGQAVILLGSTKLASPQDGWTIDQLITEGRGIRFRGASDGDLAGANVAGVGDVDGDGIDDILIAAPGAAGGKGAVYLIYGSPTLTGQDVSLADVGKIDLPGARFVGRQSGDALGGGRLVFDGDDPGAERQMYLNPGDPDEPYYRTVRVYSRGVAKIGDVDGDGKADFAISAMLADPGGNVDAGEVYVIYGRGER